MALRVKEVVFHLQHGGVALFQTKKGVWTVLGIKVSAQVVQKMLDADMLEKNAFGHYMLKGVNPFWMQPFLAHTPARTNRYSTPQHPQQTSCDEKPNLVSLLQRPPAGNV